MYRTSIKGKLIGFAMIGEPFNFETPTKFDKATITFKVDKSKLGDTKFDNLLILWYDEENQTFKEMETVHNEAASTVSTTTTHFSQYMIVDSEKWFDNWEKSFVELRKMWSGNTSYYKALNTILVVDCSWLMSGVDPISYSIEVGYNGVTEDNISSIRASINSGSNVEYYMKKYGRRKCSRASICENIINNMGGGDSAALIMYADGVYSNTGLTGSYYSLISAVQNVNDNGGSLYLNNAVETALSYVTNDEENMYRIVVITHGNVSFGYDLSSYDYSNVSLNVVNLGGGSVGSYLESIVHSTGGEVYYGYPSSSLTGASGGSVTIPPQFIGEDSDGDGIPDIVELYGLLPNGKPINTNPYLKDTDGDGLDDNVELNYLGNLVYPLTQEQLYVMSIPKSDPTKKDSDGDGIPDNIDEYPMWNDPDPLGLSNIETVQYINVPVQRPNSFLDHIIRFLPGVNNYDFTLSVVKSRKIDDDIFFAYAEGVTNTGGFVITGELKSQLNNLEKGYQEHGKQNSSIEEAAAHAAKKETDQLVPKYFEYGSSAYYGCWAYNCQSEIDLLNGYISAIDKGTNAYMIYITILGLYQSKLSSLEQETITISKEEYISANRGIKPQIEININAKQLGKKWGKHKFDYPELSTYSEYEQLAKKVFNNPDRIVMDYKNGEYFYIKNNNLLRTKLNGDFVSLYPGANSTIVENAIKNGGVIWGN